jgi:hypothetical protein
MCGAIFTCWPSINSERNFVRTHLTTPRTVAAFCFAVSLFGCASSPSGGDKSAATASLNYGSALTYPERLQPTGDASGAMRWKDSAVDFRKYDKILVERIRAQPAADSASVAPDDLMALTEYFHQSLVKALDPSYGVVQGTGRGVLRVRITILDLVATKPEVSVLVLVVPYAGLADLAAGAASGRLVGASPYLGKTAIAVEFIDGETSAVVAEYAETRSGRKFVLDNSQGAAPGGGDVAKNYLKAYSTWAYANQAFDGWAQQFRTRLNEINGRV